MATLAPVLEGLALPAATPQDTLASHVVELWEDRAVVIDSAYSSLIKMSSLIHENTYEYIFDVSIS